MDYRRRCAEALAARQQITGARILEVGGDSLGRTAAVLRELGARKVDVTNVGHGVRDGTLAEGVQVSVVDARRLHEFFPAAAFDAAVGVAIAEHIPQTAVWAASLRAVLRPGAMAVISGGPIWSGPHGHHVWVSIEGAEYRFTNSTNPLRPWEHLLHDENSLAEMLAGRRQLPETHARAIARWVYRSDNINRVPFSALVAAFRTAGFEITDILRNIRSMPPAAIAQRLAAGPLGAQEAYEVSGAIFCLRNPG